LGKHLGRQSDNRSIEFFLLLRYGSTIHLGTSLSVPDSGNLA